MLCGRGWEPDHEESDLILSFARRFEGERIEAVLVLEDAICEEPREEDDAVSFALVGLASSGHVWKRRASKPIGEAHRVEVGETLDREAEVANARL